MPTTFKKLYCCAKLKDGGQCKCFHGNIQADVPIILQIMCKNHSKHSGAKPLKPQFVEYRQSEEGVITYRTVPSGETVIYDDDGLRISDV